MTTLTKKYHDKLEEAMRLEALNSQPWEHFTCAMHEQGLLINDGVVTGYEKEGVIQSKASA